MATMKDVARELGISVTTVSRALNNYDDVAEATRERVHATARALDYHPNAVARSLQGSRANAIGLVIPTTLHRAYDAFWLEFIGGCAAACARANVDLLLSSVATESQLQHDFTRLVRGRRVDGLLLCDVRQADPRIPYLQKHKLPFVAFGRAGDSQQYAYIDVDGGAAVQGAIRHLILLGHQRIAFLGLDPAFGFSHFRLRGYRDALSEARLPYSPDLVIENLTEVNAVTIVRRLLSGPDAPTAIFAAADFIALAVLKLARSFGVAIPDDLSLAVFDDNLVVQGAEPPLTAISQPNGRLGEEATTLLLERIAHPELPLVQRLIVPSLTVRASTGPPPLDEPLARAQ